MREKSKLKKIITSPGFIIMLTVILLLASYKFYLNYNRIQELQKEIAQIENQIDNEEERSEELQRQLSNINDPEYIERMAREKLGLVKEGELLIIPVEEE